MITTLVDSEFVDTVEQGIISYLTNCDIPEYKVARISRGLIIKDPEGTLHLLMWHKAFEFHFMQEIGRDYDIAEYWE